MLFSEDRLLILWNTKGKDIPPRPQRAERFPRDDERHWYNMEYAGWGIKKVNLPESPGNGPKGKKVVYLQPGTRHPYFPAFAEGLSKIAERYGVRLLTLTADMTMEGQSRQVSKAIREKPDLVILVPINIEACTSWVKEMHAQRIPIIVSNLMPKVEAHKYIISWCGPDDWGSFRILARHFAKSMGFEGGYVIVRHLPGTSCYYSRTYSVITELKKFAPKMKCLAMSPAGKEGEISAERTMNLVTGWIRRFGHGLQGIICPDDRTWLDGINEAIRKAGREDIIMVSAGNTQKGMQLVKEGKLHALTFQPAQADGALPMKIAADWFNGLATACRVILSPSQPVCQEYAQHAAFAQQGATPLEGGL
jgi:ABC-type sugar transport system substrate-binding protein